MDTLSTGSAEKRKNREMNTLPKGSSTEDETQPLITVSGKNITNYSSGGGGGGGGGNIQYDHERSGDYDDKLFSSTEEEREANHNGRYTPVSSATTEVRPKTAWQLPHKDYDSLDYDVPYNVPYKDMVKEYTGKTYDVMEALRWILVCIIGLLTGIVAFIINICVKELLGLKYSMFEKVLNATLDEGRVAMAFLVLLGFNVFFAFIAACLIGYRPVAAGSGIPEIKCYLNGVKVPHVTRIGTLITKAVGVLFSVAGGFLVGKEGPMIHSGAIIGAGVPQFRSLYFKWLKFPYPYFRSDRDKRDFVSSGAAAGVAAAFGAPIGGVLFSLEEGSSFWNQSLTWRTLFCCFSATFVLNFFVSIYNTGQVGFGFLGAPGLVDFGVFTKEEDRLWNVYHLFIFVAMGVTGGLFGALFNSLNINLTKYRMKYIAQRQYHRVWKIVEVILIAMVTTSSVFIVAMLFGTCLPDANKAGIISNYEANQCSYAPGDDSFQNETRDYYCPSHSSHGSTKTYYNDMATLMFNSQEIAIKQLFHQNGAFTLSTLLILFLVYFFIACWTYGASIPSGLFIPCLMIGATYGRFIATFFSYLHIWSPHYFGWLITIYPGTYALIGAASFLGGVVRMTISLTVILIESTNEIEYGLPIMLTVMVAKWVGDYFNHGLYDTHIELKKTPFLEWESPKQLDKLIAEDVMNSSNSKLSFLYPITRVRSIERLLRTTAHSAFLVVTPVEARDIPFLPKNIKSHHIPQLYARPSTQAINGPESRSEYDYDYDQVRSRNPTRRELEVQGLLDEGEDGRSFEKTYTLPQHKRAVSDTDSDSELEKKKPKKLVFRGLILRHQLVMLLKNKVFFSEGDGPDKQKRIDHATLTAEYPRYSDVFSVELTETERSMLMDLSEYMNPSPYTISREAPLPQVFNLFRTMGLRHLPVIQESGIVAGIITRHDLTHERLHELRRHKKKVKEQKYGAQKEKFKSVNGRVISDSSSDSD